MFTNGSATIPAILLLICIVLLLGYRGRRSHQRRLEASRALLRTFEKVSLRLDSTAEQAELSRQVGLLRSADNAAETVERRVKASFPSLEELGSMASRDTAVRKIQKFFGSEGFAIAAGSGELAFYTVWEGLDGTPFAETIDLIGQRVAEIAIIQRTRDTMRARTIFIS